MRAHVRLGLLLVLVLALVLVACGEGDGRMATVEPTTPTTPTSRPTATPDAGESPQVIDGVEVVPLEVGDEVELPDDVALIVETGCWQCDGPTTGLVRVYRNASGPVRTDTLFSVEKLGLPPIPISSDNEEWKTAEIEPNISSFALNSDASEIVVGVCSGEYCGLMGAPTLDVQTTLFRSLDGGVTWTEFGVLDGAYHILAVAKDGVLLRGPFDSTGEKEPRYQLFPSGDPVEPPAQAGGSGPFSLPDGELLWPTEDGRLLQSDGTEFLALGQGRPIIVRRGLVRLEPAGERLAGVIWIESPRDYSGDHYLSVVDLEGHLIKLFSLESFASVGGWLTSGLAVGNATVLAEDLTTTTPDQFVGYLPALFDLDAGRVYPIPRPFLDPDPPLRNGRNRVQAVLQGPFARIVDTGSCLRIRAEPGATADVLDCAADGVLLRDMGETQEVDGKIWLRVVTPGGVEGWVSTAYLEVNR